jgi:hypothetical protein
VPNLDCKDTFCQTSNSCDEIASKLKPVSFQIDEVVFDMSPKAYLHQGEVCQFAIAENPLDKANGRAYIFGDLFLKHFYAIFDYD